MKLILTEEDQKNMMNLIGELKLKDGLPLFLFFTKKADATRQTEDLRKETSGTADGKQA